MGREVRKVPANWQHPKKDSGHYEPLHQGYLAAKKGFEKIQKEKGLQEAVEYMHCPDSNEYMPDWSAEEKTHYMMYEDTSEGTPISPAFATPEELAKWLVDTGASSFGDMGATYEQWLNVCNGGWAPSMVYDNGVLKSGVEFAKE